MSKWVAGAGVLAVVQFIATWAVLGVLRPGYDAGSRAISELAELGATTRPAMTASLLVFAVLTAVFATGVRRAVGWLPSVAVGVNAVGSLGVAAFPCSPGCPGPAASVSDALHLTAALVAYAGLTAAPLLAARRLDRPWLRAVSVGLGVATAVALAAWVGQVGGEPLAGWWQRIATTAGDAWYVVVAIVFGGREGLDRMVRTDYEQRRSADR